MRKDLIFAVFIILLFYSSFVNAFSVATIYSDNYPLKMQPGETKEVFFLLRNVVEGDSDIRIKSELVKGQDIAVLLEGDKTYDVPFGAELEVPVKISIPKDAKIGDQYRVGAIFSPLAGKIVGDGNIEFIVNIGKSFPVVVGSESEQREIVRLTVEDEGGFVNAFAPFVKGKKGIWLGIIFVLFIGIVMVSIIIIFILRNRSAAIRSLSTNQFSSNINLR